MTRRTKILAVATAGLLAINLPLAAQDAGQVWPPRAVLVLEPYKPGVQVTEVGFGSAAANAGLHVGDWITAVEGHALDGSAEQLLEIVGRHEPGTVLIVDYRRDGDMTATVTLGENPKTGAAMLGICYLAMPPRDESGEHGQRDAELPFLPRNLQEPKRSPWLEMRQYTRGDMDRPCSAWEKPQLEKWPILPWGSVGSRPLTFS